MSELSDEQVERAVAHMLDTVRTRYPNARDAATERFREEAQGWQVAKSWETDRTCVVLTEVVPARWGAPEAHLHALTDGSDEAVQELTSQLPSIRDALPDSISCRVSFGRRETFPVLRQLGLGVSKLGLGGEVPVMKAHLEALNLVAPAEMGLRMQTASTMEHVRASSRLRREYFLAHPEHGWASGTLTPAQQQAIDNRVEAEFQQRLEGQLGTDFVLLADEEVVGTFSVTTPRDNPIVGLSASFNICIAPDWQGRGLGTYGYHVMVERADELGVAFLHGSTSNPGVIRIAARIGRRLDNWLLRRDPPWIDEELVTLPNLLVE